MFQRPPVQRVPPLPVECFQAVPLPLRPLRQRLLNLHLLPRSWRPLPLFRLLLWHQRLSPLRFQLQRLRSLNPTRIRLLWQMSLIWTLPSAPATMPYLLCCSFGLIRTCSRFLLRCGAAATCSALRRVVRRASELGVFFRKAVFGRRLIRRA